MNHSDTQKARIRWRCRRGMLELDMVLLGFFDKHYDTLTSQQRDIFLRLLEYSDTELQACLFQSAIPDDKEVADFVKYINTVYQTK